MSTMTRQAAIKVMYHLLNGQSLAQSLPETIAVYKLDSKDQSWLKACCFLATRYYFVLQHLLKPLLKKNLKKDARWIEATLLVALSQLLLMRTKDHAAVQKSIDAFKQLTRNKGGAMLLNGILRKVCASKEDYLAAIARTPSRHFFPVWIQDLLKKHYPHDHDALFFAMHQQAPLFLRINQQATSLEAYLASLAAEKIDAKAIKEHKDALVLETPIDVAHIPGFAKGLVSVQDLSAQYAAYLLELEKNHHVLDACSAPGGKTAHILELCPDVKLDALEVDPKRVVPLQQTLERLQLDAKVHTTDALSWHSAKLYDRILLDAPCSGTGVIRRHSDIALLRKPEDITVLRAKQLALLEHLWLLLKPGGVLLYATCSILPEENDQLIADFINRTKNVKVHDISLNNGSKTSHGWQILPVVDQGDGFFYAKLVKV